MHKAIRRWFIITFGPINSIEKYIRDNWDTPFDSGGTAPKIRRWIPDANKSLEIIHERYLMGDVILVYLNMKLIISYTDNDIPHKSALDCDELLMEATKGQLLYLYKNIVENF